MAQRKITTDMHTIWYGNAVIVKSGIMNSDTSSYKKRYCGNLNLRKNTSETHMVDNLF